MPNARDVFGSPGISIIAPEITTRNPAPAESATSVTCSFHPRGAPNRFESSLSEYYVFAMQTGSSPKPQPVNRRQVLLRALAQLNAVTVRKSAYGVCRAHYLTKSNPGQYG
jgi:hypothetical protein